MKSTGLTRPIDGLGRFVIPKDLRDNFGLDEGTVMEILTEGETIVLRKFRAPGSCELCGEVDPEPVLYRGHCFCAACRRELGGL